MILSAFGFDKCVLACLSHYIQGDAAEAAQLRQAVAECQEWLEEAEAATNNDSSGKTAAVSVAPHNRKGRVPQQSQQQRAASGSKGATSKQRETAGAAATAAGAVAPSLRLRSSSADTSISVSSKAKTAQAASVASPASASGSGGSSLGARMREAEAAWALGLDLADPRVVRGLKELQEVREKGVTHE